MKALCAKDGGERTRLQRMYQGSGVALIETAQPLTGANALVIFHSRRDQASKKKELEEGSPPELIRKGR